jgi:hypothetical protein
MTEEEWFKSNDPLMMLKVAEIALASTYPHHLRTVRKRECFGLACCQLLRPLIAQDSLLRQGLVTLEAELDVVEDKLENAEELWRELNNAYRHPDDDAPWFKAFVADVLTGSNSPEEVVMYLVRCFEEWEGAKALPEQVAHIMRDIVGNPFRPVSFSPAWRSDTALSLAHQMYESRDFGAMPILADALQDVGCEDEQLLNHCRDTNQPHVRGCWVVDLVLGKE